MLVQTGHECPRGHLVASAHCATGSPSVQTPAGMLSDVRERQVLVDLTSRKEEAGILWQWSQ